MVSRREECRVDLSQHPDTAMAVKGRDHLLTILALIILIKLYGKVRVLHGRQIYR